MVGSQAANEQNIGPKSQISKVTQFESNDQINSKQAKINAQKQALEAQMAEVRARKEAQKQKEREEDLRLEMKFRNDQEQLNAEYKA